MKQKQKIDIDSITQEFDQFIENSLKNKSSTEQPENNLTELDQYYSNMQKRLKIKTITQDQKFQNMLGPMKKLKSFVNIKQFLRGLNTKPSKLQNQFCPSSNNTKNKLQYEDLRGGFYMQKVQNHLKRNHMKRRLDDQAQCLLRQLQQNQTQKNQYRTWIENVLGKISMKQETFSRPSQMSEVQVKKQRSEFSKKTLQEITNTENIKNLKKQNLKRRISQQQQQKNFKKVSNFLADRLRKILTDKYVNNSSKKTQRNKQMMDEQNYQQSTRMTTQPTNIGLTYRKTVCRTTATSKRMRDSAKNPNFRAQTSQLRNRKPCQDVWKNKVNNKMNDILMIADNEVKKSRQQRKENKNTSMDNFLSMQNQYAE